MEYKVWQYNALHAEALQELCQSSSITREVLPDVRATSRCKQDVQQKEISRANRQNYPNFNCNSFSCCIDFSVWN